MIWPTRSVKLWLLAAAVFISGLSLLVTGLNERAEKSLNSAPQPPQTTQIIAVPSTPINLGWQEERVVRVIDGDSVELGNGQKVRYIGIDTPETVDPRKEVGCFGQRASDENKKLVEGKMVWLEKDVSETDRFGRLLRYLYIKDQNGKYIMVNEYLVLNGFGRAASFPPDIKYQDRFKELEKEARINSRGLWKDCSLDDK